MRGAHEVVDDGFRPERIIPADAGSTMATGCLVSA